MTVGHYDRVTLLSMPILLFFPNVFWYCVMYWTRWTKRQFLSNV